MVIADENFILLGNCDVSVGVLCAPFRDHAVISSSRVSGPVKNTPYQEIRVLK